MNRLIKHADKILLAICAVVFFAMAARSFLRLSKLDEIASRNPVAGIVSKPYQSERATMPTIGTVSWPDAPAQSRGSDWVYDLFTPPVIYYNPQTQQFTVTPPVINAPVVASDDAPFEIDLVAVRQEPYRIQLVGYVGTDESYIATFEVADAGLETVIGRVGRVFDQQGFRLQSLDVRRITTNSSDSMPVVETVAVAVIVDDRTGREETLTNRERKMLPRLQAVLRARTNPPLEQVVREGMSVEVNGYNYLVTQLSLSPQQAVVSRRSPGSLGAAETRTLIPIPGAVPPPGLTSGGNFR